jgi:hypothetical protein
MWAPLGWCARSRPLVPQSLPVLVMLRSPYTRKVLPHTAYKRHPPAAYSPACLVKPPYLVCNFCGRGSHR